MRHPGLKSRPSENADVLVGRAIFDSFAFAKVQTSLAKVAGIFSPNLVVKTEDLGPLRQNFQTSVGPNLAFAYDLSPPPEVERIELELLAAFLRQPDNSKAVTLELAGTTTTLAPRSSFRITTKTHWKQQELQGAIFDLDGVLITTDRYLYQAWKELADEIGIPFDESRNHALRGVSREESLRRIYADRPLPSHEIFAAQCDRKNRRYQELIAQMNESDILPGAKELLQALRKAGIKIALASASRNCKTVLERTGLAQYVDAVSDGTNISANKPNPQVFYVAAQRLRRH